MLFLLELGRVSYDRALALQERLVELRRTGAIGDTLLLLEHPPVLTLGRNAGRENILASDEQLAARGIALHVIKRGGDVTYHGPGQLIGYPILDLREHHSASGARLGVVDYVRRLEEALIRTAGEYGIRAQRITGRTGVWTEPAPGSDIAERKLAAIGIHVSRGITSHGFALNVSTDLRDFSLIVPCGIADRAVTSLAEECPDDRPVDLVSVGQSVARNLGRMFTTQILAVASPADLHPELAGW
jgi:lipoyl(octanoyl) transferase